ncbi:MAG TPA: dockerin type I domain-containing protein, partial [Bacteroidales bacterium]|nr:dockerin type I domain-containing protein [Bacteroidales bacterium]
DVLLYKKHIAGISLLSGIFLNSGDVNGSGSLSASDVLLIKKRIALITNSFSVGDWLVSDIPVTVNGSSVTLNLDGLCYGDANASYTPPAK